MNFKFGPSIRRLNPSKRSLKISETRERGRSQGLWKIYRAAIYTAHRSVVFATAQLSCLYSSHAVPRIRSLDSFYPQNSYPTKSKMAAAAILKIAFLAITRPLLHAFAPNLKHCLKMGSCSQIYRQNSHCAKIQDGGGRHFEIS